MNTTDKETKSSQGISQNSIPSQNSIQSVNSIKSANKAQSPILKKSQLAVRVNNPPFPRRGLPAKKASPLTKNRHKNSNGYQRANRTKKANGGVKEQRIFSYKARRRRKRTSRSKRVPKETENTFIFPFCESKGRLDFSSFSTSKMGASFTLEDVSIKKADLMKLGSLYTKSYKSTLILGYIVICLLVVAGCFAAVLFINQHSFFDLLTTETLIFIKIFLCSLIFILGIVILSLFYQRKERLTDKRREELRKLERIWNYESQGKDLLFRFGPDGNYLMVKLTRKAVSTLNKGNGEPGVAGDKESSEKTDDGEIFDQMNLGAISFSEIKKEIKSLTGAGLGGKDSKLGGFGLDTITEEDSVANKTEVKGGEEEVVIAARSSSDYIAVSIPKEGNLQINTFMTHRVKINRFLGDAEGGGFEMERELKAFSVTERVSTHAGSRVSGHSDSNQNKEKL